MNRRRLLPFTLASALLLPACGTRTSLSVAGAGTECGAWSTSDGAAGVLRAAHAPFAVLGDGSVVLPMQEFVNGAGGPGPPDHWVRKIGPDGDVAWDAKGGPFTTWLDRVERGAAGELVVLGTTSAGKHPILGTTLTCPAGQCIFLAKLAETGALTWSKVVSSNLAPNLVSPGDLAVTRDGRITVEGGFGGSLDLGCGPLTTGAGAGDHTRFVARLSPSGECLWSRAIPGTPVLAAGSDDIAVDDQGEVALVLTLPGLSGTQSVDLGGGPVPFDSGKGESFALAKYAPNGDLVFGRVVTGNSATFSVSLGAAHIALTGAGELLLTAGYVGAIDFGGGPKGSAGSVRHFVTGLSAKGEELWTSDLEVGMPGEPGSIQYPFSLAVVPGGGFFLAGAGKDGMTILGEPTPDTSLFLAEYDAGGAPVSVRTFPRAGLVVVSGLDASAEDALVLAGSVAGTLDFGQGPVGSEGPMDAFVARICR